VQVCQGKKVETGFKPVDHADKPTGSAVPVPALHSGRAAAT